MVTGRDQEDKQEESSSACHPSPPTRFECLRPPRQRGSCMRGSKPRLRSCKLGAPGGVQVTRIHLVLLGITLALCPHETPVRRTAPPHCSRAFLFFVFSSAVAVGMTCTPCRLPLRASHAAARRADFRGQGSQSPRQGSRGAERWCSKVRDGSLGRPRGAWLSGVSGWAPARRAGAPSAPRGRSLPARDGSRAPRLRGATLGPGVRINRHEEVAYRAGRSFGSHRARGSLPDHAGERARGGAVPSQARNAPCGSGLLWVAPSKGAACLLAGGGGSDWAPVAARE